MNTQDQQKKPLKTQVEEWLGKQGHPLEFLTANMFHQNGFEVIQGSHIRDPKSSTRREIDVLARVNKSVVTDVYGGVNTFSLQIYHVVECKWSNDKPWIVFTSENQVIDSTFSIYQTIATSTGKAILWVWASDESLYPLSLFHAPSRPGFGGRQAFSKDIDVFYATMQSVSSASLGLAESLNSHKPFSYLDEQVAIIFPVIVLDAPLFEAHFDSSTGQTIVEDIKHARIHWRGADLSSDVVAIDLVTVDSLAAFVEQRSEEVKTLLEKVEFSFRQIIQCFKIKSLEALEIPSGLHPDVDMPWLLQQIKSLGAMEKLSE